MFFLGFKILSDTRIQFLNNVALQYVINTLYFAFLLK